MTDDFLGPCISFGKDEVQRKLLGTAAFFTDVIGSADSPAGQHFLGGEALNLISSIWSRVYFTELVPTDMK
jgi:hypothetical protein